MEPTTSKCFLCCSSIAEVSLHHHIAAEHHFSQGFTVVRHAMHCLWIHYVKCFKWEVANSLTCLKVGSLFLPEPVPLGLPFINHCRAIGLCEAIQVRDVKSGDLHPGK